MITIIKFAIVGSYITLTTMLVMAGFFIGDAIYNNGFEYLGWMMVALSVIWAIFYISILIVMTTSPISDKFEDWISRHIVNRKV